MKRPSPASTWQERGFSYVEVLVATVILGVGLVPAIQSLSTGVQGSAIGTELTVQHYRLLARMEEVLAEPFGQLQSAAVIAGSKTVVTSYSDTAGTPDRRLVYIAKYDADNADADNDPFTGVEDYLLWVRVEIENSALYLESLTTL